MKNILNAIFDLFINKNIREEKAWQNALDNNDTSSFQRYLNIYPNGKFAEHASNRIATLERNQKEEKDREEFSKLIEDIKSVSPELERDELLLIFSEINSKYSLYPAKTLDQLDFIVTHYKQFAEELLKKTRNNLSEAIVMSTDTQILPIHFKTAKKINSIPTIITLLKKGAKINSYYDTTCMDNSIKQNWNGSNLPIIEFLIRTQLFQKIPFGFKLTHSLHYACSSSSPDISLIDLLLRFGANPQDTDSDGNSPADKLLRYNKNADKTLIDKLKKYTPDLPTIQKIYFFKLIVDRIRLAYRNKYAFKKVDGEDMAIEERLIGGMLYYFGYDRRNAHLITNDTIKTIDSIRECLKEIENKGWIKNWKVTNSSEAAEYFFIKTNKSNKTLKLIKYIENDVSDINYNSTAVDTFTYLYGYVKDNFF